MKLSKWWAAFQETLLCCICCFRTKRRSMEKMFIFSGTKWSPRNREPVRIPDILSNDISELRDSENLEMTAMIHSVKDNGDLLSSTSELCLEDDTELGDLGLRSKVYMKGREVYGMLTSNEVDEGGGTTEQPANVGWKRKALKATKDKLRPSREATGREQ